MLKRIRKWLAMIMGIFMIMDILPVRAEFDVIYVNRLNEGTKAVFYRDTELIVNGEAFLSSIYCEGDLKISGSGKLTVDCPSGHAITAYALECTADLSIKGNRKGTGIVTRSNAKFAYSITSIENVARGISTDHGYVENIGGLLDIDSYGDGIVTNRDSIYIEGLTGIRSGGMCLAALEDSIIVRNDLHAEAYGTAAALYAPDGDVIFEGGSSHLNASGNCIWAGADVLFEADVEAESTKSSAVYKDLARHGTFLTIKGGNISLKGWKYAAMSESYFIQNGGELSCVGGIYADIGISLEEGKTSIKDTGFWCITSEKGGFFCNNKTTIISNSSNCSAVELLHVSTGENCDLTVRSRAKAVNANESSFSGKVFLSSDENIALKSRSVEMENGTFTMIGETNSIRAGTINMKSGTLTTQNTMVATYDDIFLYGDVTASSQNGTAILANRNVITDGRLNATAGGIYHAIEGEAIIFNVNTKADLKADAQAVYSCSFIAVQGDVKATSANAEALCADQNIYCDHGSLYAKGKTDALYAGNTIQLRNSMHIIEPENGHIVGHHIFTSDYKHAPEVLIDRSLCSVILWPNNGESWIEYSVKADDYFTLPECPFTAPAGKRFARWEYGLPGEQILIVQDLDVNAVWEDDLVSVRFSADGGSGSMSPVTVLRNSVYKLPECPFTPPSGKQFYAWRINSDKIGFAGTQVTITEDTVLNAIWEPAMPDYCTVTFDANGGSGSMPSLQVKRGENYTLPECGFTAPAGMLFSYWRPSTMTNGVSAGETITVNTDMTIRANWKYPPYYTVRFSGSNSANPPDQTIREGDLVTEPVLSIDGFVLRGWYTEPALINRYDFNTPVTKNMTIYAGWDHQIDEISLTNLPQPRYAEQVWNHVETRGTPHYTLYACVWYEIDAGIRKAAEIPCLFEKGRQYQAEITLKADTGYAFAEAGIEQFSMFELNGSKDLVESGYAPDRNTFVITTKVLDVLDAYPVVLTFGKEGMGQGELKGYEVPYNEPFTLPENMFTPPEGMAFSGWSEGKPGDVIYPVESMLIEPLWVPAEPEMATVSFVTGCEATVPDQKVAVGSYVTEPAAVSREGYQFMGWYRDESCSKLFDFSTPVYIDMTLYAGWSHGSAGPDGWRSLNGRDYWYENSGRQGTSDDPSGVMGDGTVRGREIYDPESDAWYWLDAEFDGAKAVNKEVWMPYIIQGDNDPNGKWVRYDAEGRMIKGWYTNETGTYYYDPASGAMVKGEAVIDGKACAFDAYTGIALDGVFFNGFWYEKGIRQGTANDPAGVMGDGTVRGREIYDPATNAWYWLDAVYDGAVAKNKEVWMPYVYQGDNDPAGKWVRYDSEGHMIKGWYETENGWLYYDQTTGGMVKGTYVLDGIVLQFDPVTGILIG